MASAHKKSYSCTSDFSQDYSPAMYANSNALLSPYSFDGDEKWKYVVQANDQALTVLKPHVRSLFMPANIQNQDFFEAENSPTDYLFDPALLNSSNSQPSNGLFTPIQSRKRTKSEDVQVSKKRRNLLAKSPTKKEDRPYKCQHCPAAFSRNHDLKRHTR